MRAAFTGERDARRRRDQNEARLLVAGVVQGIEAARDEGIVERADRQQAFAENAVAQSHRRQHQEQVVLGDAELDVLAPRGLAPQLRRHDFQLAEHILRFGMAEQAAPVDPGAEIGRDRDVGRGRQDICRERAARRVRPGIVRHSQIIGEF